MDNSKPISEFAHIKKTFTQRCSQCRKYVSGDPYEHLRLFHGGKGAIEEPGAIDYASHPAQVTLPSAAITAPVNQLAKPTPPATKNPFLQQYAGESQSAPVAPQNDFMMWNFQHPVIVERQQEIEKMEAGIRAEADKLNKRSQFIEEEKKKLEDMSILYRRSGGMMQPVRPNSFEGWRAAFGEITGVELSFPMLILIAAFLYFIVIFFDIPGKLACMFTPLISAEGRKLVEARGQFVKSPQEYVTLTKNQWHDVHRGLEALDVLGNEKIPMHKLLIKTQLMDHFQNSTLDQVFILLHKASDVIEQCRNLASVGKLDKNGFTDAFIRCANDRMP